MKKIKYLTALYVFALALTCCNKPTKDNPIDSGEISYDGINLYYHSSDKGLNEFLNDFTHRNMRYDNHSVGKITVGGGTGFQKNWETMAISFQNSIAQVYNEDKFQKISNYLLETSQDDQGLIYNTPLVFERADSYASDDTYERTGYSVPQGWPFPFWELSVENVDYRAMLSKVHTIEFNFNGTASAASQNWIPVNGTFNVDRSGYGKFASSGAVNNYYFYRENLDQLLTGSHGIDTRYAPMIDMEIAYNGTNVADYNIIFKVEGDDSWHRAPQSLYASTPTKNVNGNVHVRQFIDMYLFDEWNRKTITDIGVEFVAETGKTCTVSNGQINFMRPSYDTRQSNATYQFILALYNYYIYTRDTDTLIKLMSRARKGLLFLTHALQGENGLLSLEYLYGHDGVVPYSLENEPNNRLSYHGIGNGYWDLCVSPIMNFEANTYFYQALKAMAVLEDALKDEERDDKTDISVKNRIPDGERVNYDYDSESLLALAAQVKSNMERNISKEQDNTLNNGANAGDYNYKSTGGFYNPETGRFVLGINEHNGDVLDFGYVYLNLEAVAAGIGTPEQQQSIMDWVDGKRIVSGDNSTGDDIYFYEFAPRFNTKDCDQFLNFYRDENNAQLYREGFRGKTWSRLVQNGGAIIAWSYYDIVARSKVLGVNNAVNRLSQMKKWYKKVLAEEGDSLDFYSAYYDWLDTEVTIEDPEMERIYRLQTNKTGSLGLDTDFIESVILIRAIPDGLFGMDASHYNNLQFTYGANKYDYYFEIYNMKYGDAVYSIRSKENVIEVFNINGVVDKDFALTFRYKTDNQNLKIKVNGQTFTQATYEDGYIYVTVPFDNVKVIFG